MSTHVSLRFMLKLTQCFGLLPVCGITGEYNLLKFRWTSKRTLFSLTLLFVTLFYITAKILTLIDKPEDLFVFEYVFLQFLTITAINIASFISIASKWPNWIKQWSDVDLKMIYYGRPYGLEMKLRIIAIVLTAAAIVEQILSEIHIYLFVQKQDALLDTLSLYYERRHAQVFRYLPYHILLGFVFQVFIHIANVMMTIRDVFILYVSILLSGKFKLIANHVRFLVKKQKVCISDWCRVREDYTRLLHLSERVDDVLSTIIVVSFGNNVFMLAVQLYFYIRDPAHAVVAKIYHIVSFSLLITRTIAVTIYAATVDSESKNIKFYLYRLKSTAFNKEYERFLNQMHFGTVALTGNKLFKITKPLVLKIACAVVSYELILVHFIKNY